ncbi:MAG: endonuclease/exonuclease/phosphatase family protein [Candidatus Saccharimonadales bacterium]
METRITSFNVQGFEDWQKREPCILDYLHHQQPDIIFFQEVTYIPELSPFTQTALLNKTLDYPYEHSAITRLQKGQHYETYREGLAVLSKLPIIRCDALTLKKDPADEHQRIVQFIDVAQTDGSVMKLANIHLSITDFTEEFARAQLKELLDILDSRGEQRIIGGDFNMNDLDIHADLWQNNYTSSSTVPYISYPGMNKRNDYFLVPKQYNLRTVQVSPDGISDHRAVSIVTEGL